MQPGIWKNDGVTGISGVSLLGEDFTKTSRAIFIVDGTGWILDCNKAAEVETSLTREALLKERIFMLSSIRKVNALSNSIKVFHKMDLMRAFADLKDDPTPRTLNAPIVKESGDKTWYTFTVSRHVQDGTDVFSIRAEKTSKPSEPMDKRETSEQRYRYLFDTQPLSIILINDEQRVIECNFAMEQLTGYPMGELVGRKYADLPFLTPAHVRELSQAYERFLKGDRMAPVVLNITTKDGRSIWAEILSSFIEMEKRDYIQIIAHDVTERVKYRQLIEEENKQLKDLEAIRKTFITNATHEIRTPLTSIDGASAFLVDKYHDMDDARRLDLIRLIRRGSIRLRALTEALLDFSGFENKELAVVVAPTVLRAIIQDAIAGLSFLIQQRHPRIDVPVDDTIHVLADRSRIEQVFSNLISNAVKNTSPRGNVEVTAIKSNEIVIVSVKDDGVGIEPAEMGMLFQKFGKIERPGVRADVDIQGPGIGLYITREIIKLHGGMIWAESAGRGKGATFKFTLPIARIPQQAREQGGKNK